MTRLVLSAANSQLLRRLAQSGSTHDALQSLKTALQDQPKMTADSPAVPSASTAAVVLDHSILVRIATWAQSDSAVDSGIDKTQLKLSSLVRDSSVYIPPKPIFQRSKQLEDSLSAIRKAQEQAEYQRMSTTTTSASSYKIPTSYVNISGVDPTLPLNQRISNASSPSLSSSSIGHGEEQAWKDAQRLLSVILNIFLSTLATATAAWWASGNAKVANKVLASMLVALVTAVAEVVLYNRYSVYVSESKKVKASRMKGSDVKVGAGEFRPLQLGSSTTRKSQPTQPTQPSKEPS